MKKKYIAYGIILLFIAAIIGYCWKKTEENETHFENFTVGSVKKDYQDIYDGFYSGIYNQLFSSRLKNQFEIFNIKKYTMDTYKNKIKVLDIGCGNGEHLKLLDKENIKCVGLDKSIAMLNLARKKNPGIRLINGDYHNKSIVKRREFSHILCLFYTIYYCKNLNKTFRNFNHWLKPKGFLCIHLVQPTKFDPILESSSSLIPLFNPQKHSHSRKTHTDLHFNNFKYESDWKFNGTNVKFVENFILKKNGETRTNIHKFKMYPSKKYIKIAQKCGFKLFKRIDLTPANHEFNSIYIFQKIFGK